MCSSDYNLVSDKDMRSSDNMYRYSGTAYEPNKQIQHYVLIQSCFMFVCVLSFWGLLYRFVVASCFNFLVSSRWPLCELLSLYPAEL